MLNQKKLSNSLNDNYNNLIDIFKNCTDIIYRDLLIGKNNETAILVYIESITDTKIINQNIISPIMTFSNESTNIITDDNILEYIKKQIIRIGSVKESDDFNDVVYKLLLGNSVLIINNSDNCLIISSVESKDRAIEDSISEGVLRGPKVGFTEILQTNIGLIRQKIKSSDLKIEKYILGNITKTEVLIIYIENIVNSSVLVELKKRLEAINIDSILESSYIEELIEDTPNSFFPQIKHTERPDKVVADIIEGRIAIMVDGTPVTLIVPTLGMQFLQSSEDYYERHIYTNFIRLIRLIFFFIALLLPGLYVAATTFHQELIPTLLLIRIGSSRVGIPFPTWLEVIILDIAFEGLREAGLRLPKGVGQSVTIVGALVIGDAAVKAGIVSPLTVIIVALTGIASFSIPSYDFGLGTRLLHFLLIICGGILGLYGITILMIILLVHVLSLNSFGIPYMAPIAPFKLKDMKDAFFKKSWKSINEKHKNK
jgi:spore germination protein KA